MALSGMTWVLLSFSLMHLKCLTQATEEGWTLTLFIFKGMDEFKTVKSVQL